jgi:hypothetical protein
MAGGLVLYDHEEVRVGVGRPLGRGPSRGRRPLGARHLGRRLGGDEGDVAVREQGGPRLGAHYAVGPQVARLLEGDHGVAGLGAEEAVGRDPELALNGRDRGAAVADAQQDLALHRGRCLLDRRVGAAAAGAAGLGCDQRRGGRRREHRGTHRHRAALLARRLPAPAGGVLTPVEGSLERALPKLVRPEVATSVNSELNA